MKPTIVVVGSLNMDIVINVDHMPKEGQTLIGTGLTEIPGGKGANQAVAIGKLQAPVSMIGKVGADPYGTSLLNSLTASNVNTEHIVTSTEKSGVAVVTVDQSGSNHIIVIPGANFDITEQDIELQRQAIEQCEIVVLQLEVPMEVVKYTLQLAKQLGKTTILNPAPAKPLDDELLSYVDILIPNEHELADICGIELVDDLSLQAATQALLAKGVQSLIVTLGEKGCCYADHQTFKMFPAHKVKALDTTAAGDSFIGGFAASYVSNPNMDEAIRQAQIVAAITVTRAGAQSSLPTLAEVQQFGRE